MTRIMRLYYYGVAGAIGGLIAWQLSNLIGLSFTPILYLNEMIVGAVIGLVHRCQHRVGRRGLTSEPGLFPSICGCFCRVGSSRWCNWSSTR